MNGYFQLEMTPQGTLLHIYKHTGDGIPLNINELADYLNKKGIEFDIAELNKKIMQIHDKGTITLDDVKRYLSLRIRWKRFADFILRVSGVIF